MTFLFDALSEVFAWFFGLFRKKPEPSAIDEASVLRKAEIDRRRQLAAEKTAAERAHKVITESMRADLRNPPINGTDLMADSARRIDKHLKDDE